VSFGFVGAAWSKECVALALVSGSVVVFDKKFKVNRMLGFIATNTDGNTTDDSLTCMDFAGSVLVAGTTYPTSVWGISPLR